MPALQFDVSGPPERAEGSAVLFAPARDFMCRPGRDLVLRSTAAVFRIPCGRVQGAQIGHHVGQSVEVAAVLDLGGETFCPVIRSAMPLR